MISEDKLTNFIFSQTNLFYAILSGMILLIAWFQHSTNGYWSVMFQALCLGFVINSWLFSRFQIHFQKQQEKFNRSLKDIKKMSDPTYNKDEINAIPKWKLAFELSEIDNENAPIGWSKYVTQATHLLNKYYLEEKKISYRLSEKETVSFKMTAQHFETLLSGNIVKVTNNSGKLPIEFFMDDIGLPMLENIFDAQMAILREVMKQSGGIKITSLNTDDLK